MPQRVNINVSFGLEAPLATGVTQQGRKRSHTDSWPVSGKAEGSAGPVVIFVLAPIALCFSAPAAPEFKSLWK